jgi:hypothetical protein
MYIRAHQRPGLPSPGRSSLQQQLQQRSLLWRKPIPQQRRRPGPAALRHASTAAYSHL